jgi:hypothetical protein
MSADGMTEGRKGGHPPFVARPTGAPLLEHEVREIERRLRLHRDHAPKKIAADLGVHPNTISCIALGRHRIQQRLRTGGAS